MLLSYSVAELHVRQLVLRFENIIALVKELARGGEGCMS